MMWRKTIICVINRIYNAQIRIEPDQKHLIASAWISINGHFVAKGKRIPGNINLAQNQ
jgi:hypothetical protein